MQTQEEPVRKYILVFAIMALVLTACRIESNVGLDISEDGSATLTVEIGFDDEFLALLSSQGDISQDDFLDGFLSDADGAFTERKDGDMNYYAVTTDIADLSTWDAEVDTAGFSSFTYIFDDEGAVLTANLVADEGDDLGGEFGFDPSEFTGDFISANLIVRMPGTVTEHNADEVRDGALVWNLGLTGATAVSASSSFGGSGFPWVLVLIVAVLSVALIAGLVALVVSRRENEKQLAAVVAAQQLAAESDDEDSAQTDDADAASATAEPKGEGDSAGAEEEASYDESLSSASDDDADDKPESDTDAAH